MHGMGGTCWDVNQLRKASVRIVKLFLVSDACTLLRAQECLLSDGSAAKHDTGPCNCRHHLAHLEAEALLAALPRIFQELLQTQQRFGTGSHSHSTSVELLRRHDSELRAC